MLLFCDDPKMIERCEALLRFMAVRRSENCPQEACFHFRQDVLFYGLPSAKLGDVFSFDLVKEWNSHRGKNYSLKKEPLAKSLGIKGDGSTKVIDATCGTGKDSILLLTFGARVEAYERNPVVAFLFYDALLRALEVNDSFSEILRNRFSYHYLSAVEAKAESDSVIYLDPMYPHPEKKKSALPRKEMQLFRHVVGDDLDADQLFSWAIQSVSKRIVVKRPLGAPFLGGAPTHSFEGKSTRYDLYSR